ncbi:unnamed protein product, partial [Didymodactylos carnosus]
VSYFFADEPAAVLAGRIRVRYTEQCLDLEMRLKLCFDNLEFYAVLTVQPVNLSKTEALWSSRAIGAPKCYISVGDVNINWANVFKYLGYFITSKLDVKVRKHHHRSTLERDDEESDENDSPFIREDIK